MPVVSGIKPVVSGVKPVVCSIARDISRRNDIATISYYHHAQNILKLCSQYAGIILEKS